MQRAVLGKGGWSKLTEASKRKLCFVGVYHRFQRNSYRPALRSEKASPIDVVGPILFALLWGQITDSGKSSLQLYDIQFTFLEERIKERE